MFQGLKAKEVKRPVEEIDDLIGFEYAGFHPIKEQYSDHLLVLKNQSGRCHPRCGGCKCGKCPMGSKNFTVKEERESSLISEGLTHKEDHWEAKYPNR